MTTDDAPTSNPAAPVTPARPVVGMISILARDPRRVAAFWAELMQLPVAEGASEDLVMLDLDHQVSPLTWIIERSDELSGGVAPFALDIGSEQEEGWDAVAARAEELGARRIARHEDSGVRWIELRDPEDNRFRVFAPRPSPSGPT